MVIAGGFKGTLHWQAYDVLVQGGVVLSSLGAIASLSALLNILLTRLGTSSCPFGGHAAGTASAKLEELFSLHSLPFKKVSPTVRDRAPAMVGNPSTSSLGQACPPKTHWRSKRPLYRLLIMWGALQRRGCGVGVGGWSWPFSLPPDCIAMTAVMGLVLHQADKHFLYQGDRGHFSKYHATMTVEWSFILKNA